VFILMLIPLVNIVIVIIVYIDLAKSFGKGVGFGIGLLLLGVIFIPILVSGFPVRRSGGRPDAIAQNAI